VATVASSSSGSGAELAGGSGVVSSLRAADGVAGHERARVHRQGDRGGEQVGRVAAEVGAVGREQDAVALLDEFRVVLLLRVGEGVAGGDRLGPQVAEGQGRDEGIRPGPVAPGEVLGMAPLVERDRRHVAVEMHGGRPRVVAVAAEEPAREQGLTGHGKRPERVAVAPADGLVVPQPLPVVERRVLVDPHLHVIEIVGGEILADRPFGAGRHGMVVDAAIPQQDLAGDAERPAETVEDGPLPAALDLVVAGGRDQFFTHVAAVERDFLRLEGVRFGERQGGGMNREPDGGGGE
jgi:hypothetical protein